MEVKKVCHLDYGDRFIWLDDETRAQMSVRSDYSRLQVLKLVDIDADQIYYQTLDGYQHTLYYNSGNKVIIVPDDSWGASSVPDREFINFAVRCNGCGEGHGSHYTGSGTWVDGICCDSPRSGKWFVPNERDLRKYHPGSFEEIDDFFASIGL
jgi:hypothetical protein